MSFSDCGHNLILEEPSLFPFLSWPWSLRAVVHKDTLETILVKQEEECSFLDTDVNLTLSMQSICRGLQLEGPTPSHTHGVTAALCVAPSGWGMDPCSHLFSTSHLKPVCIFWPRSFQNPQATSSSPFIPPSQDPQKFLVPGGSWVRQWWWVTAWRRLNSGWGCSVMGGFQQPNWESNSVN